MKLLMRNDSLRLRLTQTEVDRFAAAGVLEDAVGFGPTDDEGLVYRIRRDEGATTLSADLLNNQIDIRIPAAEATEWTGTKKVAIEAQKDIGNGRTLNILIEKDFARLKPRRSDDVVDKFPNPRSES
ncbi:MAG TPA: hypothetical protein PLD38_09785 [Pyrinomonadaceae bacterium]|nr:hypothetical protein [Chloracidobacterium sp.]HQY67559.1 hypothetical protein [Pyrinomonadaceae bacterium]MBK9436452.1 hypothetical protein [Chloracidobacterium sp.]MBK9767322.1 hypothetical protein [Chloracidobacterium sp.]MBL0241434.1 hypothetical protein [Chloracidobacterium sp.]